MSTPTLDFGLTKFHRERSRSFTKNTNVGYTYTYAPPEIDIEAEFMSRSSDIWSFGCVLLEMVCWLLEGWELSEAFADARLTEDASGIMKTDSFFAIPQFIRRLDHHESCTNYVHDILDTIEKYMIVVRTEDVKRASTSELLEKFKDVDQRVQDDNQRDYIAKPTPGPRKTPPKAHIAVEAHVFTERSHQSQRQSIRVRQIDDAGLVIREPHSMTVDETLAGKKESSPEKLSNAGKKSGLAAAQMIEAKVFEALESFDDTDTCLVKFLVRWQVPPKKTTSSSVSFLHAPSVGDKVHEFHISLEELKPLEHGTPGTFHPGVFGLQMTFDAMLELAEIVCDVSLEDDKGNTTGIYLDGISFFLYPTSHEALPDRQPVIQWHLKEKTLDDEGDRDPAIPPNRYGGPLWTKIPTYDTLRTSITVLGYCEKAMVQLGTEAHRQYHNEPQYSHAEVEKPNIEASLNSLTLGSSAGGAKAEGSIGFWLRTGHKRELDDQKGLTYKQVLRISQSMPVIIYDTQSQNERAWMVSQLSMILELFNIWAQREGMRGIQYATASADGGAAAFKVLANRSYSERIAIEKMADEDPSDIKISGIIKRLYGRIQRTRSINASSDEGARGTLSLGRCSIKGWDWLELVDGLERAEIGDLIVPEQPDQSKARKKGPIQTLPQGMNDAVVIFGTSRKKQLS
ncbi:hypothetical protein DER46DRAFT_626640 [Fusarium sp. MPI-SDFR-AT-0072]|nr:hypothetical protein DER46DRAFT_626640 [Fusarium sp. MPI-SDFR-AT-0072]